MGHGDSQDFGAGGSVQALKRKGLLFFALLLLLLVLAFGFRARLLAGIGNFLVIRDKLEAADIIFLLNGDPTVRPNQAAKLVSQGWSSKVVIARAEDSQGVQFGAYPNVTDSNIIILGKLGIPDTQIVELRPPGGVRSTNDEAKALLQYSQENPVHSVIIVTSDLHSRRARYIFQKVLAGSQLKVSMAPIPDRKYGAENWWRSEDGIIGCQNEYIKLLYYYYKY